ncbi:MAG: hypothetical protein EP297_13580 [Gammaproteobacteria bacterium]|nr:MAG: hypothetical protein EP297_13580 [Gammaproteobacteria bacterium]
MKEGVSEAAKWNKFSASLLKVNDYLVKGDVRTEESEGGYGGLVDDLKFYLEIKTYDKATGNLLSNVKWEKRNPDNLHAIEVYIFDKSGQLKRDYAAAYLPVHRKAPYQTLINLYHHNDDLSGYRQFDASDNLLYEQCKGLYKKKEVFISLDHYEIPDRPSQIEDKFMREVYRACFDRMPASAGRYLDPLEEIPSSEE